MLCVFLCLLIVKVAASDASKHSIALAGHGSVDGDGSNWPAKKEAMSEKSKGQNAKLLNIPD